MKALLTTILLASFISIAVFGVFGMSHGQTHDMDPNSCISATTKGIDCPEEASPIDFLAFHINAYNGFSLATFSKNLLSQLLLVFASVFFIGLLFFSPSLFKRPQLAFSTPQQHHLTHWLSLHENSPAAF